MSTKTKKKLITDETPPESILDGLEAIAKTMHLDGYHGGNWESFRPVALAMYAVAHGLEYDKDRVLELIESFEQADSHSWS